MIPIVSSRVLRLILEQRRNLLTAMALPCTFLSFPAVCAPLRGMTSGAVRHGKAVRLILESAGEWKAQPVWPEEQSAGQDTQNEFPARLTIPPTSDNGMWHSPRWDSVWFPDAFIGPMAELLCALPSRIGCQRSIRI